PRLFGWIENLADPALWEQAAPQIWHYKKKILDCGTLVFNEGEAHCRKLIPSYREGRFVCREEESREFVMEREMNRDLDLFCRYDEVCTQKPSKGEDFPVPLVGRESFGDLYLRCDQGNPGAVYQSIEALPGRNLFRVGNCPNVHIDNLCLKYIGAHAIGAGGHVVGLKVTNCEIGWVGGTIQHYFGTDPNYPQGRRGTVTRFGNGVEIYGGCDDYEVRNCYIYQVYDAAITHQINTKKKVEMKNIRYCDNLIEDCVYGIEYFLDQLEGEQESFMENVVISGNHIRRSGYGWGQQRHNQNTPAAIKGWSYSNPARNFVIRENLLDQSAYRLVHLVAAESQSCPRMEANTYVKGDGWLGLYGANSTEELDFNEQNIRTVLGDERAKIE
ncbi:MAG: hypothetical protein IJN82_00790, partial [Clostridia bacterium]|nr:hypothetical protein [Clostridia bacterium]